MQKLGLIIVSGMVVAAMVPSTAQAEDGPQGPAVLVKPETRQAAPEATLDMKQLTERMGKCRRTLGMAHQALKERKGALVRENEECSAIAGQLAALKKEIAAREEALQASLMKDEKYVELKEGVSTAQKALDAVRKELYGHARKRAGARNEHRGRTGEKK